MSPAPEAVDAAFGRLLLDARAVLGSWTAPDAAQERARRRFLAALDEGTPALRRDGLAAHLTAGALVLSPDGSQVLLTLHRKAGLWLQLGGHLEPADATVADAALREAREESGLSGIALGPLVDLDEHELGAAFGHCSAHLDLRFAASATEPPAAAELAPDPGALRLAWWPVDSLPDTAGADVPRLVRAALRARPA